MDWLYFVIFGLIAVALGLFGSVFNCYSSLYLAKDNDLLLSMPIPVGTIIASRLFNVYLMGTMYSALVFIPGAAVYQIRLGVQAASLLGSVVMLVEISLLVLMLSCLLGWAVAKVSLRLKGRSIVKVLASLVFIILYYVVYYKAQALIQDLLNHAEEYGARIKGSAYFLYLWGENGVGSWSAILPCLAVCILAAAVTWVVLAKSFIRLATSTPKEKRTDAKLTESKPRSLNSALLHKEFARFTASSNYMLNCGFGILFMPAGGILLLIKGRGVFSTLEDSVPGLLQAIPVVLSAAAILLASMNDMAAPSISLEGKSLWILQALPIPPWKALQAKLRMQLILTELPMLFFCICAAAVVVPTGLVTVPALLLSFLLCLLIPVLNSLFALFMGLKMPNLDWTNEIVPIKQSGCVALSILGSFVYAFLLLGGYYGLMQMKQPVSTEIYLAGFIVLTVLLSALLRKWLKQKGTEILRNL